ncbi:LOW QUALITY PROTEIN: cyclin-D3-2-like [Dioscorea cayenensis subsp. rotundata]|uniref:LOW QUALITY PROTEIN: cyclin-D3-2-like n=1 Tax=Dioscorea cayennensis subsp. rotundata TaxID=55577 RepID=A0AB40BW87_DIOCR|nr:LOW QUALITY PROTEIN: cyclin-D3-2-like [Dioscorea cayenensis subsp. rotundata]
MDSLYCPEPPILFSSPLRFTPHPDDFHPHLSHLLSSESHPSDHFSGVDAHYSPASRSQIVLWLARATARIGFSPTTLSLAVNYLDRCFLPGAGPGLHLQPDKPWMSRLSAIACLSLAAKVEEQHVPLLLDLQSLAAAAGAEDDDGGGHGSYFFEPKTVRRMELLILSSLGWRMNPVTPLSFIDLLLPNFNLSCASSLLSAISDWRWVQHPPSAWASAAILHSIGDDQDPQIQSSLSLLNASKDHIEECLHVIQEATKHTHKHIALNHHFSYSPSCPASPNAVIGSCFSCESSSVPSSPDRPSKRPRQSSE